MAVYPNPTAAATVRAGLLIILANQFFQAQCTTAVSETLKFWIRRFVLGVAGVRRLIIKIIGKVDEMSFALAVQTMAVAV